MALEVDCKRKFTIVGVMVIYEHKIRYISALIMNGKDLKEMVIGQFIHNLHVGVYCKLQNKDSYTHN